MVYFIGTAGPIPDVPWDAEARDVHIGDVSDAEAPVLERFPDASSVRYLGSHLHCGCGFRCETLGEEPDEAEAKQRSHERLAEYLRGLPADVRPVRLYGFWSGDVGKPAQHTRQVAVDRIADPDFHFRERELLTIVYE